MVDPSTLPIGYSATMPSTLSVIKTVFELKTIAFWGLGAPVETPMVHTTVPPRLQLQRKAPLVPEPHAETKYTSVPVEFSAIPDAAQPFTGGKPLVEPEFVCPSSAVHMSSFMPMLGSPSVQATTPFSIVICWYRGGDAAIASSYAGCYDVTPDYNPGGKGGTYNDAGVFNDISVWYMGTRENVFDDTSPPPVRAAFNLLIFSS